MIFTTSKTYNCNLSMNELHEKLKGSHLTVHHIDFEIFELIDSNNLKIVPHTEHINDKATTLPITELSLKDNKLKIKSKIRRIDKGLLYFFSLIAFLMIVIGFLFLYGEAGSKKTGFTFLSLGLIIFIFMYYRLSIGYFDYVNKIQFWVKNHID